MEKDIVGKNVKIIWNDGTKIKIKEGLVLGLSMVFISIRTKEKDEMIPLGRIVRIEMKGEKAREGLK